MWIKKCLKVKKKSIANYGGLLSSNVTERGWLINVWKQKNIATNYGGYFVNFFCLVVVVVVFLGETMFTLVTGKGGSKLYFLKISY